MSESMDTEEDADNSQVVETAVFGGEVRHFLEEDRIGQYLIKRALRDLEDAQEQLINVDPTDYRRIVALQLEARVAERVRGWLSEAIEAGQQAEWILQQERHAHGT